MSHTQISFQQSSVATSMQQADLGVKLRCNQVAQINHTSLKSWCFIDLFAGIGGVKISFEELLVQPVYFLLNGINSLTNNSNLINKVKRALISLLLLLIVFFCTNVMGAQDQDQNRKDHILGPYALKAIVNQVQSGIAFFNLSNESSDLVDDYFKRVKFDSPVSTEYTRCLNLHTKIGIDATYASAILSHYSLSNTFSSKEEAEQETISDAIATLFFYQVQGYRFTPYKELASGNEVNLQPYLKTIPPKLSSSIKMIFDDPDFEIYRSALGISGPSTQAKSHVADRMMHYVKSSCAPLIRFSRE